MVSTSAGERRAWFSFISNDGAVILSWCCGLEGGRERNIKFGDGLKVFCQSAEANKLHNLESKNKL